jgi:rubrerythrin
MKGWTLETIPWGVFDPSKVDPDLLQAVKAAALVERNGLDYGRHLDSVFADDAEFRAAAAVWAVEEVRHGEALGRWAQLADPTFDFEAATRRFRETYRLPTGAGSLRGSRAGELMARCIVETGTSSYYTAMRDATEEPVLKRICAEIAADELRHYKLFYSHMRRYVAQDGLGRWGRLRIGLGRIGESEDDELACAFWAANAPAGSVYERAPNTRAYARRAYALYRLPHVHRAVAMVLKAVGWTPNGRLNDWAARLLHRFMQSRVRRLAQAGA